MINDPGCCGAHYSLQSRVPDPRLLAFVTADEYAKKLEALDEMFVAQSSGARLLEKLKRHRCVVALVFLTLLTCIVTGAVTSVMLGKGNEVSKVFFHLVAFILLFISLAYMVDSCRYKSRVIEGHRGRDSDTCGLAITRIRPLRSWCSL